MTKAITIQIVPIEEGGHAIMLALRNDAIVELYANEPRPGVILRLQEARLLAEQIQSAVKTLESVEPPPG